MSELEREIEQSWTVNAAAWTAAVRDDLIESRRVATNAAILDAIHERNPRRVLDVGCGEGWLTHRLAARGIDAVGFDSSEELLARARAGAGSFRLLSYTIFTHDPAQAGGDYDVVVCNFSLLGEAIAPVIRACRAVLVPDGALIIQTVHPFADAVDHPYVDGWRREDFRSMRANFPASMPWYFRTMRTWIAALTDNGFRLHEIVEPTHPHSQRPLSLILVGLRADSCSDETAEFTQDR